MKKLKFFLLTLTLIISFNVPVKAQSMEVPYSQTEYLENGDYIETTITILPSPRKSFSRSGEKNTKYRNSAGTILWSVTVRASFSYVPGKSSKCTSASGYSTSKSSSWKVSSATTSKNGNSATATATGTQYKNSKPIGSITRSVTLSCDSYGNLS